MWNKHLFLATAVASSMVTMHWVLNAGSVMIAIKDKDFSYNYISQCILTAVAYLFVSNPGSGFDHQNTNCA